MPVLLFILGGILSTAPHSIHPTKWPCSGYCTGPHAHYAEQSAPLLPSPCYRHCFRHSPPYRTKQLSGRAFTCYRAEHRVHYFKPWFQPWFTGFNHGLQVSTMVHCPAQCTQLPYHSRNSPRSAAKVTGQPGPQSRCDT